jgi:hypothetical protein
MDRSSQYPPEATPKMAASVHRYKTPEGTYDLPFTWTFDASALTNGSSPLNQTVYIQKQAGDFILRRVVGLTRILDPATGLYQLRDRNGEYIEQVPILSTTSADDLAILPELEYQATGAIRFDLQNILKPAAAGTAQLAFQGVRRVQGELPPRSPGNPKTYTYVCSAAIASPAGGVTTVKLPITDYDFELYQIILVFANAGGPAPGIPAALTTPVSSLWLYDSNAVQVSNAPVLDLFCDGGPGGVYRNGAIVTPLYYPKDSVLQLDVYSQLTAGSGVLTAYLVGCRWFPC